MKRMNKQEAASTMPSGVMAQGGQSPSMQGQQGMMTPQPAQTPNYIPPPPPTPAPGTQSMEDMKADGGEISRGKGFKEFFADVNIVDVVISAFIVAGITYAMYYYKYMMQLEKTGYADMSDRLRRLESSVQAREAELNAIGNATRRKRPVMRIA